MSFFAFIAALFPTNAMACPDFLGDWESSGTRTREYNDAWGRPGNEALNLIRKISGTMKVRYTESQITMSDVPSRKIEIAGEQRDWAGVNETVDYELLGCTDNAVAIRYQLYGKARIATLNFDEPDTYWEYTGSPDLPENFHAREYFVRTKRKREGAPGDSVD